MKKLPNSVKLIIKIAVTAACLWYVSNKINWGETFTLLAKSNKLWVVAAAVLFTLSKLVSAVRLNIYFKNIDVRLSENTNTKLYWLGMFYNLFLPGGIGGDAYKVILLNRELKHPLKPLSAAVLLDRLSGVAGLGILGGIYFYFVGNNPYNFIVAAAILPGIFIFYFIVKKVFPSFVKSFTSTLMLGLAVQLLQVLCVYCIMASIGINDNKSIFIFIFLLSSVVAILPFTIGGLGAREVVFLWGSNYFFNGAHQEESVYISILFYLITVIVSLVGIIWVFKKIDLKQNAAVVN